MKSGEKRITQVQTPAGVEINLERFGSPGDPMVVLISGAGAPMHF